MNETKRTMNGGKISSNMSRYSGKDKDMSKMSASRSDSVESQLSESDVTPLYLPVIKQGDNAKMLPRYNSILTKTSEDVVAMIDLDQLQQDLEKLLSTCAVRHRTLVSEVQSDDKKDKKYKVTDKVNPSLKRKRPDEKLKTKENKNGFHVFKKQHYPLPVNNFIGDVPMKHEIPKVSLPRNETSGKFWLSIESYCSDVVKDDVNFLDDLINECSQEVEVKVPEIGEHYAMEWTENALNQEQTFGNIGRPSKAKTFNSELKKNGLNAMVETFSSPLTQRLLSALLEENVGKSFTSTYDKIKDVSLHNGFNAKKVSASDFVIKSTNGARGGLCLDKRLRKEAVELGILDVEDLPKTFPPEDEVLQEIKKCQQELSIVNEHNMSELNKLRTLVAKDMRRQEVKLALEKVDNQVMNMYNNILITKQKIATEDENKWKKQTLHEYESEVKKIIDQQVVLHRELTELSDFLC